MSINLTDLTNLPPLPVTEIPRDHLIAQLVNNFGTNNQIQILKGEEGSGKTVTASQFVRQYPHQSISYFITDDPQTHRQHTFIYYLCTQIAEILGKTHPDDGIGLESLKSLLGAMCINLSRHVKEAKKQFYFLVDGIDRIIDGNEGERIIDVLPQRFSHSPYLLITCRSSYISKLPTWLQSSHTEDTWPFTIRETQEYLKNSGFTEAEIVQINERHGGNPNTLRNVAEVKNSNPTIKLADVLAESDKILEQRINLWFEALTPSAALAIEFLSTSPSSLPIDLLSKLTNQPTHYLPTEFANNSFLVFDHYTQKIGFATEVARNIVKQRLDNRNNDLLNILIQGLEEEYPEEEFLISVLATEKNDYEMIQQMLRPARTILSIREQTSGVSNILKRLHTAAQMARERKDADGVLKWSLYIAVIKSYFKYAIDFDEVEALIAIGRSEDALRKAYYFSDLPSKIRLIAKTYSEMQEQGENISNRQKEELQSFVEGLNIHEIELDVLQRIAIDLFPILPDVALNLLEKLQIDEEQKSIMDVAAVAILESYKKLNDQSVISTGEDSRTSFDLYRSRWIAKASFTELRRNISKLESVKAKEQYIRHWCRRNQNDNNLPEAINLWLDTVVADRSFVIPLLYLRQICELLLLLTVAERRKLANRLNAPKFTSLNSPKEEWVRVRLSLIESLFDVDDLEAVTELLDVYSSITADSCDLDVKVYCLARLLSSLHRFWPSNKQLIQEVETQFNSEFYRLLNDSADHYDHVRKTIQALVEFDPEYALVSASELNLEQRRQRALFTVLRTSLKKHNQEDVTYIIDEVCQHVSQTYRDNSLAGIINELCIQEIGLLEVNIEKLGEYVEQIINPAQKARALADLAQLQRGICHDISIQTAKKAVAAWRQIKDLRTSLTTGYELVSSLSVLDKNFAGEFFDEVQQLKYLEGAVFASGHLGVMLAEVTRLALRSITSYDLQDCSEVIQSLESIILLLPSPSLQIELYAKLASSLYRSNSKRFADDIVRTKVMHGLQKLGVTDISTCDSLITMTLPVITEYDLHEAKLFAKQLPTDKRDVAWHGVTIWILSHSFLGDHLEHDFDDIRIFNDHPTLRNALEAASQIVGDVLLYSALCALCNNIKKSCPTKIDPTQALLLLEDLDQLADKRLPDKNNIQHEGYLVLAHSATNQVRSFIVHSKMRNVRGLSQSNVSQIWRKIASEARKIPNLADRVFVMALVAQDMCEFYKKADKRIPKDLVQSASSEIPMIPTALDRVDRLSTVAEAWHKLSEQSEVEFILQKAISSFDQLRSVDKDDQLSKVVQVAYNCIGGRFATELIGRLDNFRDSGSTMICRRTLEIEKLRKDPSVISLLSGFRFEREDIVESSAERLLADLAAGRGRGIEQTDDLFNWLCESNTHDPSTTISVANWVVENGQRGSTRRNQLNLFFDVCDLIVKLARSLSQEKNLGISESIQNNFAGLNSKYITFRPSEAIKAQEWLQKWLKENSKEVLKICDPYFSLEQLVYLKYVPNSCKVLVITTDKSITSEHNTQTIRNYWYDNVASQIFPFIRIQTVPYKFAETEFHDRVILTNGTGLDMGPSLNGLGLSFQKVRILELEDVQELDQKYLRPMLDSTYWLLDKGQDPRVITLNPSEE